LGLLILLIGAEAHALRRRHASSASTHRTLAILIAIPGLLFMALGGADMDILYLALAPLSLAYLGVMTLVWFGTFLIGRGRFPWWALAPGVLGPVAAWVIHTSIVRGQIDATLGWIGIWSALALALTVSITLGLRIRQPEPFTPSRSP
jgi:hypothetical protein